MASNWARDEDIAEEEEDEVDDTVSMTSLECN